MSKYKYTIVSGNNHIKKGAGGVCLSLLLSIIFLAVFVYGSGGWFWLALAFLCVIIAFSRRYKMNYCTHCSFDKPLSAKPCPYCGHKEKHVLSFPLKIIILFVLLIIFLLIGYSKNILNISLQSPSSNSGNYSNTEETTIYVSGDINTDKNDAKQEEQSNITYVPVQEETSDAEVFWYDEKLGLYQSIVETKEITGYGVIHIYGGIGNASTRDYSYIEIIYSIYDENGNKTGDAIASTLGVKSGETWKFSATGMGDSSSQYKFDRVIAR